MIQRSYRNLLINLSRGFCKDSKNDNFKNKNEENKNRSKDRKDRKLF